jgi:hypothetical protein
MISQSGTGGPPRHTEKLRQLLRHTEKDEIFCRFKHLLFVYWSDCCRFGTVVRKLSRTPSALITSYPTN